MHIFCALQQGLSNICEVGMKRHTEPLSLSLLGTVTSNISLQNAFKGPNRNHYQGNNFLRQILILEMSLKEVVLSSDTVICFLQDLNFLININKSYLQTTVVS